MATKWAFNGMIELTKGDFLHIASADKYANIYLCENEILRSVLIRNTLKHMEEKLSPKKLWLVKPI